MVSMKEKEILVNDLKNALLRVDRIKTSEVFSEAFEQHNNFELIEEVVMDTLTQIGEGWEKGDVSLAQVYMSGVLSEKLINEYIPKFNYSKKSYPKIGIAVLMDKHSL